MATSEQLPERQRFELDERDVDPDPFVQFRRWLDAALAAQQPEPHAMTLATATRGQAIGADGNIARPGRTRVRVLHGLR